MSRRRHEVQRNAPAAPQTFSAEEYQRLGTEDDFQSRVVAEAKRHGWLVFFVPNWMYGLAMASLKRGRRQGREWPDKGFPDVWCLHPRRGKLLVLELKTMTGRPSTEQKLWLAGLQAAGLDARLARPSDLPAITRTLRGED